MITKKKWFGSDFLMKLPVINNHHDSDIEVQ